MSKHLKFFRATALCALFALPALAEDAPDIDSVVASVNGQEITLGEMIAVRDALPQEYQNLAADVLFNGILNQLIQQSALSQEISETPKRVEIALKNERRALLAAEVLQDAVANAEPTPEDIQAAYDEQFGNATGDPEFNASHILVETQEEAIEIRDALLSGADFAEMAKEKSTGPSGPSGGALGWFGMGQMVKPFEDAVAGMNVGDISEPVQTQFGWHLIILNDKRTKAAPSLDSVRPQLVQDLQSKAIDAYVADLTEKADVDRSGAEGLDVSVIERSDLLDPDQSKE